MVQFAPFPEMLYLHVLALKGAIIHCSEDFQSPCILNYVVLLDFSFVVTAQVPPYFISIEARVNAS